MQCGDRKFTVKYYNVGISSVDAAIPIPCKPTDSIRFVVLSDTHEKQNEIKEIPAGDVLLHAGDFTLHCKPEKVVEFNDFLGTLPHKHKIVIAGNHEILFEEGFYERTWQKWRSYLGEHKLSITTAEVKSLLTNCTFIEDQGVEVMGVKIYGSPWSPECGGWAFGYLPGKENWTKIPQDTCVLVTHGPPQGILDKSMFGNNTGCPALRFRVHQVKPLVHIFGHIHETYGVFQPADNDLRTVFINGSTCNAKYRPTNRPIVFDLIPEGNTNFHS